MERGVRGGVPGHGGLGLSDAVRLVVRDAAQEMRI